MLAVIRTNWQAAMPSEAKAGVRGKVSVEFGILPDGTIVNGAPRIVAVSGVDDYEKAATHAIYQSLPFEGLPREFYGQYLKLRIIFSYNIKPLTEEGETPAGKETTGKPGNVGENDGGRILSDTQGVDFGPYVQQTLKLLRRNWVAIMPEEAKVGKEGKVSIVFNILRDGGLSAEGPKIEAGSGVEVLDNAAMNAVRFSEPFDALPQQFHGRYLKLRIIFSYNLRPLIKDDKTPAKKD